MSLDVYLEGPPTTVICICDCCGHGHTKIVSDMLYHSNVTHNLNKIAAEAGIYECLWRPDEHGITTARQIVEPLWKGINIMKSDPGRFRALNPENGWGSYDNFVPWCEEYLKACEDNPEAIVRVSR